MVVPAGGLRRGVPSEAQAFQPLSGIETCAINSIGVWSRSRCGGTAYRLALLDILEAGSTSDLESKATVDG